MLRTANTGTWLKPTDQDALLVYADSAGYKFGDPSTDRGAVENDVCNYMVSTGIRGHKAAGTTPIAMGVIDDAALDRIRWTIQLYGSCRIGVNLPTNAEDQFDAGVPWDVVGNETIDDGHDVPLVSYAPNRFACVTWGRLQPITPAWLKKFGEEAHLEYWPDFLMASGLTPDGYDAARLEAVMKELAAA
jgi:hypothetical protein